MSNAQRAKQEALEAVADTWAATDKALGALRDSVFGESIELREALCRAIERAMDAEDRVAELEGEIARLREEAGR